MEVYIKKFITNLHKKLVIIIHGLPINSYSRRKKTRQKLFQEIAPYTNLFITINPLEEKTLRSWGLKNKIITILHGAPDEILSYNHILSKKELGLSKKLVIFSFGLIHEKKGLEYLLEGFKNFTQTCSYAKLTIAGETLRTSKNQSYLSSLQQYVTQNNINDNVTFITQFLRPIHRLVSYLSEQFVVFPYIKRD